MKLPQTFCEASIPEDLQSLKKFLLLNKIMNKIIKLLGVLQDGACLQPCALEVSELHWLMSSRLMVTAPFVQEALGLCFAL